MKEKLIVYDDRGIYRIGWYLPDDDDMGMSLGEDLSSISQCKDKEHKAATIALYQVANKLCNLEGMELDGFGFYWESKSKAQAALRLAKQAVKDLGSATPMPEWAKQALAAGWKAPKGWKP